MAKKDKKMHIVFLLDETGSMDRVKKETISGFNEYINSLRKDYTAKDVLFTMVKFNSRKHEVVYNDSGLEEIFPLTEYNYIPDAMTPLYDAIGRTIGMLSGLKGHKQPVLFIIQTDGEENSSREYTREQIFQKIGNKKELGWTFVFLGADQDAWLTSQWLNISRGNTMSYDSRNTQAVFASSMASVTRSYTSTGGQQSETLVDDNIDEDDKLKDKK